MRRDLLAVMIVVGAGCGSAPSGPSSPAVSFFVTSATSTDRKPRGPERRGRDVPAAGGGRRPRNAPLARVSQRRAGRDEQQPADQRPRSDRHRPVVQRAPHARRQQRGGIACEDRRRRCLRRRIGPAHQRPMARLTGAESARHSHGIQSRRDGLDRAHMCGLDVRLIDHRRPSWPLRRPGARWEYELGCSRRGTRRTRARVAPIPYLVAEPASSTASRDKTGDARRYTTRGTSAGVGSRALR